MEAFSAITKGDDSPFCGFLASIFVHLNHVYISSKIQTK